MRVGRLRGVLWRSVAANLTDMHVSTQNIALQAQRPFLVARLHWLIDQTPGLTSGTKGNTNMHPLTAPKVLARRAVACCSGPAVRPP